MESQNFCTRFHVETLDLPTAPKVGDRLLDETATGIYEVEVIDIHVIAAEAWTADVECAGYGYGYGRAVLEYAIFNSLHPLLNPQNGFYILAFTVLNRFQ